MQFCVNCGSQAGYLHSDDCPRPKFYGIADRDSPAWRDHFEQVREQHFLDFHEYPDEEEVYHDLAASASSR